MEIALLRRKRHMKEDKFFPQGPVFHVAKEWRIDKLGSYNAYFRMLEYHEISL